MNSGPKSGRLRLPRLLAVWTLSCLVAFGLAALGPAAAQQRQAVPGTSVSLVPPMGFVAATGFAGFMNESTQASVLVAELPAAAYAQIAPVFADRDTAAANFSQQGVTVAGVEEIGTADGATVPLVHGSQEANGLSYDKWVALFKGEKTVLVTVQSPKKAALDRQQVVAMLATVVLGGEPSLAEKLDALPFAIQAADPFRVVDTFGGSGVLMTVGELGQDPAGAQAMLIAAYQLSAPIDPAQVERVAEQLLSTTREFESAQIAERKRIRFAGAEGVLLSGTHEPAPGSVRQFAQYLAIGENGRFIRMIVSADEAQFAALGPSVEAIADSVAFKSAD